MRYELGKSKIITLKASNKTKQTYTQLGSRKQVIAFWNKEAQHPLK